MKKAFSLIELLVVIGILAILMGVLVVTTSGGTESARAARCLTNMRSLATACNTAALSRSTYPLAGSAEIKKRLRLFRELLQRRGKSRVPGFPAEVPRFL